MGSIAERARQLSKNAEEAAAASGPKPNRESAKEFSEFSKDEVKQEAKDGNQDAEDDADEFGDFDGVDEMVQGGGFGELEGLMRKTNDGNVVVTDDVLEAEEALQFLAFREVTRAFLVDGRSEKSVTNALLLERSADTEDSALVVARAERFWANEFEKLTTAPKEESQKGAETPWDKTAAKKVLQSYYNATVEGVSDQKEQDAGLVENLDDTWVHRQESEIAKALNGALARDRKRNKILQKLSQLGERLTPEDAAEMARARLAAAEAAAAVGGTVAPKAEEPTFSVSKAGLPRSTEREEVNLRAFVKMDPDVSLEQLGLFAKVYAPSEKDAEEAFQPADSQKSVTISDS